MDFKKKRDIKTISISLDPKINDILEKNKINKSKLVNFLIKKFFENIDCEEVIKKFLRNQ